MKKCNALKGKWCKAVKEIFQHQDPVSKGLCATAAVRINVSTGKAAHGHGLLYRQKSNSSKYIWLNFCPFCGADVRKRTPTIKRAPKSRCARKNT